MMKSARFIATISLLCLSFHARACIVDTYAPSEYYLFHLVGLPDDTPETFNPNSEENCRLWQQQTSPEIPLDDIYQVVYKFDIESITALKSGIIPEAAKSNQMAQWLVDHDDQEALDFLLLAKNCEWLRLERQSPWYYPSKNDPVRFSLNEVADRAMSQREPRFAGRYALQAVRALISLGRYDDCIRYWSDVEATLPDGLMRQMTLPYIGGAYLHVGNTEEAKRHFIMANDLTNLMACDQHYHNDMNRVEKMELLYESYPDCPEFRTMLWKILGHIEPDRDWGTKWQWGNGEQDDLIRLALLCDKVIQGDKAADKALWAYAATYIAHLQGDDIKADRYMKIAEKTVKDQPLEDAVKVMRMYLDAQLCTYDKAYEQRLFGQLQWLQDMLEKHIDDEAISGTNNFYGLKSCRSYYYWSDAMRCILLGTVCPKMLKSGKTTLALQLANMADYALLNEINAVGITCWDDDFVKRHGGMHITLTLDEFRHYGWFNDYDYGTNYTLTLEPAEGYELKEWRDGIALDEKTNTLSGLVYGNINIECVLQLKHYTITATVNDEKMGTVTGAGTYEHGSEVKLTATANEGYQFTGWSNGSTDNPRTFDLSTYDFWYLGGLCVNESSYFQTNFSVEPEDAGYLNITNQYGHDRNNQKFIVESDNETAYLTPMEKNGWYRFDKWENNGMYPEPYELYDNPGTYSLNLTLSPGTSYEDPDTHEWIEERYPEFDPDTKALFVLKDIPVSFVNCPDENGSVEQTEGSLNVGSEVTLVATPNEGYLFDQWADGNTNATRTLTITPELLTELKMMGTDPETGEMTYEETPVDMGGGTLENYHPESEYILNLCAHFKVNDSGVEDIQTDIPRSIKVIRNGVIYIIRNGKTYNEIYPVIPGT